MSCLCFWKKKNDKDQPDYLASSLVFTLSSFIYFLGSIDTVRKDNSFYNVTVLMGNLFYVLGYCYYMYECKKYADTDDHINNPPYMRRFPLNEHLMPPV